MDFTSITSAVDFSAVLVAMAAIGATIAAVYVGWKGLKLVLRAIRSA